MARENLVGTSFGGYTIDRAVGEGGTSSVYDAHHPQHGRVALKVLRERLRGDATAVARFVREAKYGARVQHPNVVRTIETGEAPGGIPFLAIEWASGELLEKYARRRGALESEEVSGIVVQIASAIDAAHRTSIVHRDLKPENVMYDPERQVVKLLDFGIAVDTTAPAEERLTRTGFFVGTLMYVAPEALSGEIVQPAADQYSLATIAYFLLTGVLPYTAKQPREMFTQLLTMPPVPLNQAKEGLRFHSQVETVVMRGLAKQPGDRYSSVLDFAIALEQALTLSADTPGLLSKIRTLFSR